MTTWAEFVAVCVGRHGVATLALAETAGIGRHTYQRIVRKEAWPAPYPRVRLVPGTPDNVRTDLAAFCASTRTLVAVARESALWLHGLRDRPPDWQQVLSSEVVRHQPVGKLNVTRARWLTPADVEVVDHIPTLTVTATIISMACRPRRDLLAVILAAIQQGKLKLGDLKARLAEVGPIQGRTTLMALVCELEHRMSESVFDDEVREGLAARGYRPSAGPVAVDTPDGRGVKPDVLLPWGVAVEPQGDRYHRTRRQRQIERRRMAQYAGTGIVVVPVDWTDWILDPESVYAAIDAAILKQWERGEGRDVPLPPHLRKRVA